MTIYAYSSVSFYSSLSSNIYNRFNISYYWYNFIRVKFITISNIWYYNFSLSQTLVDFIIYFIIVSPNSIGIFNCYLLTRAR
jgi:hypothetical protein